MRTIMITGGTDGIGLGLGLHYLEAGDRVVAIGSSAAKGQAFLDQAAHLGAGGRASFLRADLTTFSGIEQVIAAAPSSLDVLALAAQRFAPTRIETTDGLEATFALGYLSRFILGERLLDKLEKAPSPLILNIAAAGGGPGKFSATNLQMTEGYGRMAVASQTSRRNDLLAVGFVQAHPTARTRYVLYSPGLVYTGMTKQQPQPIRAALRLLAKPVAKAIVPMIEVIDNPPTSPLTVLSQGNPVSINRPVFDPDQAHVLRALTDELIQNHAGA